MKKISITMCLILCCVFSACSNEHLVDKDQTGNISITPPTTILFDSIDDIVDFVSAVNASKTHYDDYLEAKNSNITPPSYNTAKNIATNVSSVGLPQIKSNFTCDKFGCTYYVEPGYLDIIYTLEGIRYRFNYSFNLTNPYQYEGTPILTSAKLGSFSLDLYQGENCFVGCILNGTIVMQIIVYTEQIEKVNLDPFIFEYI